MYIIATDLDRTLFPNGNQEYDGSMKIFSKMINKFQLVFVTGRNVQEVFEGIKEYEAPMPNFVVAEVGTRIYKRDGEQLVEDERWLELIASKTKGWDIKKFQDELSNIQGLRLQEKFRQNNFKLSYYLDNKKIASKVAAIISRICNDAAIIYSKDESSSIKFLDILPKYATKVAGLEYIREKLKVEKENVIYCGDSGNDLLPLIFGYKSILVKNAIGKVKKEVRKICSERNITLYIAKGNKELNGYYVSGIVEGLRKLGIN
jgi:HAD superfamily hydrolase (TIGR01484 family)